jgi:hypothetical protein
MLSLPSDLARQNKTVQTSVLCQIGTQTRQHHISKTKWRHHTHWYRQHEIKSEVQSINGQ